MLSPTVRIASKIIGLKPREPIVPPAPASAAINGTAEGRAAYVPNQRAELDWTAAPALANSDSPRPADLLQAYVLSVSDDPTSPPAEPSALASTPALGPLR